MAAVCRREWCAVMEGLRARIRRGLERVHCSLDRFRIRQHLRRAERDLRAKEVDLSREEREEREKQLDRLREYWREGSFPTNGETFDRTPCFVGANGVPCAMGYLMLEDGEAELVEEISDTDNTVWIEDVEDGLVLDWIESKGLTKEEAARIQPAYGGSTEIFLAQSCGPVSCSTAQMALGAAGLALFAGLEYAGYRLAGDMFPDNALKRRSLLAYATVMNLFMVPFAMALVYALLP